MALFSYPRAKEGRKLRTQVICEGITTTNCSSKIRFGTSRGTFKSFFLVDNYELRLGLTTTSGRLTIFRHKDHENNIRIGQFVPREATCSGRHDTSFSIPK